MPKKVSIEEFIKRANKIHNNKYNYSLVELKNVDTKIKIICPEHGMFEQIPYLHLRGSGCPSCKNNKKLTTEEFIEKAKKVHGDKYDYSLVEYKNKRTKVKIICKKHGVFEQLPYLHLRGSGCFECNKTKRKTTKEFIEKANKIHNNKYDYSLTKYEKSNIKVKIICKKHGIFEQIPTDHLNGHGCPVCKSSKGEEIIRLYLEKHNIKYEREKRFNECKNKNPLPFDFYLPEYNILIEFDGKQHFEVNEHFGGKKGFEKIKKRDKIKDEFAKENAIKLVRIPYWEINTIDKNFKFIYNIQKKKGEMND